MKRYSVLLISSFVIMVLSIFGALYFSGGDNHYDDSRIRGHIVVYTTLPAENVRCIADTYAKSNNIRVNFVPMTESELESKLKSPGKADLVIADSRLLRRAAGAGWLQPYISEYGDSVGDTFKDNHGFWTGIWYDPVVFCINKDYMRKLRHIPNSWEELAAPNSYRLGITDFMAADNASNIYMFMVAQYGEERALEYMRALHPKVVQYAKYLSTPARMAGMGEADISIAVQSEVLRYVGEGYPLKVIYPAEGTAYTLTGIGLMINSPHADNAREFLNWMLTDAPLQVMQENGFYFMPANSSLMTARQFSGKNVVLYNQLADYPENQRRQMLDRWLKEVRFGS
ncbi:MAG: extracellular solute-binding protein [Anaerovibrio sp.]|uniref:extracellular solute-binding protein n=1 Tax=Anaerovibrio sp. TaxID=1872532 RepID=UPI0025DCD0EF|nr:extracellular solute-binding protein [Anaerovibrio sp.]MCR5175409.1 extracellular solute-binding protein [Anaerovibrio sp.]